MNLQALADAWDDPQVTEAEFRRFWLNQPVPLIAAPPSELPNWAVLASAEKAPPVKAIGVAVDPDRMWCSIGSAGVGPFVDLVRRDRFGTWHLDEIERLHKDGAVVVIDKKGPASDLIDDLMARGVHVEPFGLEEYITACSDIYDAVDQFELRQANDDDLNAAVAAAGWRKVGDRRVWARRGGDITALEAVTLALWGVSTAANYDVMQSAW